MIIILKFENNKITTKQCCVHNDRMYRYTTEIDNLVVSSYTLRNID